MGHPAHAICTACTQQNSAHCAVQSNVICLVSFAESCIRECVLMIPGNKNPLFNVLCYEVLLSMFEARPHTNRHPGAGLRELCFERVHLSIMPHSRSSRSSCLVDAESTSAGSWYSHVQSGPLSALRVRLKDLCGTGADFRSATSRSPQ